MSKLHIGEGFSFPADAITQTFGILAVRRAGKSNAAAVMAEEMFLAKLPFVVIDPKGDWWGLRAQGETDPITIPMTVPAIIFGGDHGDVPLERGGGAFMADLIAEQHPYCVLDVSEFSEGDKTRFLLDFAERLYRKNRSPLHLFLEEADDYIPQKPFREQARLVGAFERLVRRGGFRGIGVTLISQRSAVVNKNVLTQIETLIVLRTTSPHDRKAILGWVEHQAEGKDIIDTLPSLKDGEAYVWSPNWLGLSQPKKIQIRRRATFDSAATPKAGKAHREPATLATVDLAEIKQRMAATIERAKAEDPKELKKKIAELESWINKNTTGNAGALTQILPIMNQADAMGARIAVEMTKENVRKLARRKGLADPWADEEKKIEKPKPSQALVKEITRLGKIVQRLDSLTAKAVGRFSTAVDSFQQTCDMADIDIAKITECWEKAVPALESLKSLIVSDSQNEIADRRDAEIAGERLRELKEHPERLIPWEEAKKRLRTRFLDRAVKNLAAQPAEIARKVIADGDVLIGKPTPDKPIAGKITYDGLGRGESRILKAIAQHEAGVTREQLSLLTGYKRSTRDAYIARLREQVFIEVTGAILQATPKGVQALGPNFEPLPTGSELRTHWIRNLPQGEREILKHLIEAYPEGCDRETLSQLTGYKRSTRDAYIHRLRTRQLITTLTTGELGASENLF